MDRFGKAFTHTEGTSTAPQDVQTPETAAMPSLEVPASSEFLPPESDAERLIDVQQIGNYLGFVLGAVTRRRHLAAKTFVLTVAATTAAALLWPKSYVLNAKLLVQVNEVMASLVNPGRTTPREAGSPTRAAEEIVLQHDNLLLLIKQTDLLNEWERSRTGLLKVKDWIFAIFLKTQTEQDRIDAMVGLLEDRLKVTTSTEGAVNFDLRWPDARTAYEIVDHAIQNFLQFKKRSETSAIADSIAILDQSVQSLEAQVNRTISAAPKRRTGSVARRNAPAFVAPAGSVPATDMAVRLARLKTALDSRHEEITRLQDLRRQQLSELQSRLLAATTVYTEGHPTIVALRQSVAQLSLESPELTAARLEVEKLETEYDALNLVARTETPRAGNAARAPGARGTEAPGGLDFASLVADPDANDPTSLQLKVDLAQLATVRERANAARAELSSTQAGFKYQYIIIRPAQVPRRPASPNVPAIIASGVLASLLLAVVAAVATDLASGRILEPWQVERQVGVPVVLRLRER